MFGSGKPRAVQTGGRYGELVVSGGEAAPLLEGGEGALGLPPVWLTPDLCGCAGNLWRVLDYYTHDM